MTDKEYFNIDALNSSLLGELLVSPKRYTYAKEHQNDPSDETSASRLGTAIHCYLFKPEEFEKDYAITTSVKIEGMMGKFIEKLVVLEETCGLVAAGDLTETDLKNQAWISAGFKQSFDTVLKNFAKEENQDYYNELKANVGKICLTEEEFNTILSCVESIRLHKAAYEALALDTDTENKTVISEECIEWTENEIKCKIKPDRITVYSHTKELVAVDLKTTSKTVYSSDNGVGFANMYISRGYHRQAAFYIRGLKNRYPDFSISFYCAAVETTGGFETVLYKIPKAVLDLGDLEVAKALDLLKWYTNACSWDYPKDYYESDGVRELNPDLDDYSKKCNADKEVQVH